MATPTDSAGWRVAYDDLGRRVLGLPAVLRATTTEPAPALGLGAARRVITTGIGSSAAHARLLAYALNTHLGWAAGFRPLGAFLEPTPTDACDDLLVVISQGLAPNARLPLADLAAWRHVVLLTATRVENARAAGRGDVADYLEQLAAVGVEIRQFSGGAEEYGTLVRVTGPMAGYLAVLRYVEALATSAGKGNALPRCDGARLADAVSAATAHAEARFPRAADVGLAGNLVLVASGDYVALTGNLQLKVLEGMLRPLPPVFDLLDLAHGPFQQAFPAAATFLALTRRDAPREAELLDRFAGMLAPERHRLVTLPATLPMPWAICEHEAAMNVLMLREIAGRGIDQARWPGQGRDRALYLVGSEGEATASVPGPSTDSAGDVDGVGERRLGSLAWPELRALLDAGPRTAIIPLGATEQHGPHLPFATDTWIADAVAARLALRLPEAVILPAFPVGCSREHAAFAGTLAVSEATLGAVLRDVLASLAGHGFAAAFVFSAHGGNAAPLAAMLPALAAAAAPMPVHVFTDLARLGAALTATAARFGITPAAAGHHAGELETSIVAALVPDAVRVHALAAGHVTSVADPQSLFYPSLRDHAPSGTVGDPRAASATRAEAYLEAWVDVLEDAYRRAKNNQYANGTQNA
jgi:creatinine amidohydrolase